MNDASSPGLYGKFRATVSNNVDPLSKGRIQVMIPDVSGFLPSTWAMPCVPIAGKQMGFYAIPQIGDGVWIEFEHGDPAYPVWVGGYWGSQAEVPPLGYGTPSPVPHILLQTTGQNMLMLSDATGIMIKAKTGATILINDAGITISNGKGAMITLASSVVDINTGALTIK